MNYEVSKVSPISGSEQIPSTLTVLGTKMDSSSIEDVDIEEVWRGLQTVTMSNEVLLASISHEADRSLISGDLDNLEKLVHFFPQTIELLKKGPLHEMGIVVLKKEIKEGSAESAVGLMDILGLEQPLQLSEEETDKLMDVQLQMCATADGNMEYLSKLGIPKETIQRLAIEQISRLLDYNTDETKAALEVPVLTNIICAVPEIEEEASRFIGKFLEQVVRRDFRRGIFTPTTWLLRFFEEGKYPLQPNPYEFIQSQDVEEGIRHLLTHVNINDFDMAGFEIERDARLELYELPEILKHVSLSEEFLQSPEVIGLLKHYFVEEIKSHDRFGIPSNMRDVIQFFAFSPEDVAEIERIAGDSWDEDEEPKTIDNQTGEVEPNDSDEKSFNEEVKALLPNARDVIKSRPDVSWIIKTYICRYYPNPQMPEHIYIQFEDDFPDSMALTAPEIKALTIAWHELSQARQIEDKRSKNVHLDTEVR